MRSVGPTLPSANAPGGVAKTRNVKLPAGISAGHVRPKLATAVRRRVGGDRHAGKEGREALRGGGEVAQHDGPGECVREEQQRIAGRTSQSDREGRRDESAEVEVLHRRRSLVRFEESQLEEVAGRDAVAVEREVEPDVRSRRHEGERLEGVGAAEPVGEVEAGRAEVHRPSR